MADVRPFEAGSLDIRPNEAGSAAFRELGGVQRQFANQSGAQLEQGARAMEGGIKVIGKNVGDIYDEATKHDDGQAKLDADRKSADFEWNHISDLDSVGAPKQVDDPDNPGQQKTVDPPITDPKGMVGERIEKWESDRAALREQIAAGGNDEALKKFDADTMRMRGTFREKAYRTYTDLSYKKLKDDITGVVETRAAIVAKSKPEEVDKALDEQLATIGETIDGTIASNSTQLSATDRTTMQFEMKREAAKIIISRALDGLAEQGDAGRKKAEEIINSGKYDQYIGSDRKKFMDELHAQEERARVKEDRLASEAKHKADAAASTARADYGRRMMRGEELDIEKIVSEDPRLKDRAEDQDHLIKTYNEVRQYLQHKWSVDPNVSASSEIDLRERITSGMTDPNHILDEKEIYRAFREHRINLEAVDRLTNKLESMRTEFGKRWEEKKKQAIAGVAATIDPGYTMNGFSALGRRRVALASDQLDEAMEQAKLEHKDPMKLLDSSKDNPDYFFKSDKLKELQATPDQTKDYKDKIRNGIKEKLSEVIPNAIQVAYHPDAYSPPPGVAGDPVKLAEHWLGAGNGNGALVGLLNSVKGNSGTLDPAKTSWCARFMNSILAQAGLEHTTQDGARSFLRVGEKIQGLANSRPGDVIVFQRNHDGVSGHVGMIEKVYPDGSVDVLGGNQGGTGNHDGSVIVEHFPASKVASDLLGIRRMHPVHAGDHIPGTIGTAVPNQPKEPQVMTFPEGPEGTKAFKKWAADPMNSGKDFIVPEGKYKDKRMNIGTIPNPDEPRVPMSR